MKNKIDNAIYGYDPKQFMPIYRDGQVENRRAFVAYKIKRMLVSARGKHVSAT